MTPTHPRDPEMDPLLSRALSDVPAGSSACLDAETIAAWVDRGLVPAAATEVEGHVSSCAHCQAMLAALVRSTPEPTPASSFWHSWHVKWLVPVAGATAAVALFVATRPEVVSVPAPEALESRVEVPGVPETLSRAVPPSADAQAREEAAAIPAPQAQAFEAKAEGPSTTLESSRADQSSEPAPASPSAGRPAANRVAEGALAASASTEVRSPVTSERWRIGAGLVEHSVDSGVTWQPVAPTGLSGIQAGSSPAPGLCWLVGSGGAVWLTTDGRQFGRVPFPEGIDLASVAATSARSATVTAADGRLFRTDDRGVSWRQ